MVYQEYLNRILINSTVADEDLITVIDPEYWLPTYGPMATTRLKKVCSSEQESRKLSEEPKQLCAKAVASGYSNVAKNYSYLKHHWVHSNLKGSAFKAPGKTNVIGLIKDFVPVQKKLGLNCK